MSTGLMIGLAAALTLLALVCLLLGLVLTNARRVHRRLTEELTALRGRLDQVEGVVSRGDNSSAASPGQPTSSVTEAARDDEPEYVITTAGLPALDRRTGHEVERPTQIDARQFASVAVGESLVRIVSLAYGVRRALSAENRNRIGFEVRRQIRRARRRRKRELKEARRHLRATQRREDAA